MSYNSTVLKDTLRYSNGATQALNMRKLQKLYVAEDVVLF